MAVFGNKVIPSSNCIGALLILNEGVMRRCLSLKQGRAKDDEGHFLSLRGFWFAISFP